MGNCRLIQQILVITYFGVFFENHKVFQRYLGRDYFLQFFTFFSWHISKIVYLYLVYFHLSLSRSRSCSCSRATSGRPIDEGRVVHVPARDPDRSPRDRARRLDLDRGPGDRRRVVRRRGRDAVPVGLRLGRDRVLLRAAVPGLGVARPVRDPPRHPRLGAAHDRRPRLAPSVRCPRPLRVWPAVRRARVLRVAGARAGGQRRDAHGRPRRATRCSRSRSWPSSGATSGGPRARRSPSGSGPSTGWRRSASSPRPRRRRGPSDADDIVDPRRHRRRARSRRAAARSRAASSPAAGATALVALVAVGVASIIFDGLSQTVVFASVFGVPGLVPKTLLLLAWLAIVVGAALCGRAAVSIGAIGAGLLPIAIGYLIAHYLTYLLDRRTADRDRRLRPAPAGVGPVRDRVLQAGRRRGCPPGSSGRSSWPRSSAAT